MTAYFLNIYHFMGYLIMQKKQSILELLVQAPHLEEKLDISC